VGTEYTKHKSKANGSFVKELDYQKVGASSNFTVDKNLHPEAGALVTPHRDRNA
jgi:hypothetical protein